MYFSIVLQICKPSQCLPTPRYFKVLMIIIIIISILSNCAVTTLVTAQIECVYFWSLAAKLPFTKTAKN